MTMLVGKHLGPYEILSPLGTGGMGEVYRARDTRLDRDVAIKVLPAALSADKERILRFEREAKVLASLNHPHIAAIYGFEESDGKRFLVMELVEGETLAERLERGPIPIRDALELANGIAVALEAAHEKGVVHRDLKPANVKVTPDGSVKVLDFGLAKAMTGDASTTDIAHSPTITAEHTRPGVVLGTATYMSPEQARGLPLDKRTDVWSFGAVLYECLAGRRPFEGETTSDLVARILEREPDWSVVRLDTPPLVRLLLRRCLTKDRNKRLRDIGDARIELENAIADPTSSLLGIGASALKVGHGRPAAWRRALIVVTLLVAVVAGSLGTLIGRRSVEEPARRTRKYEIAMHDHGTWNVGQPAISPDGQLLAYVDRERIWIRHLDSWVAREVEESHRGIIPFWSPDSRWLAFGRGKELLKVPAAGGRPVVITKADGTFELIAGGAWSPDGRIFFSTGDAGIFVVSAEGGVAATYVAADLPDDDDFHELTLMPDGQTVVFTVHSRTKPWYLASYDGKERRVAFSFGEHYAVTPAYSPTGHLLVQRFGDASSTWAIPFDPDRLEPTGTPFLVADGDSDPSVSNTGTLVLTRFIAGYFGGDLVKVDLERNDVQPFASLGGVHHDHALSPDGKSLAVSGFDLNARDLWIVDVQGSSRMRLTFDETTNEVLPRWSPRGTEIAFAKTTATAFERIAAGDTIHFANVDGSGETRAPIEGAVPTFDAAWKYVAFVRTSESTGRDIYFMPMDGSAEPQSLLTGPYFEEYPALSPDGHWLAYTSNESGAQAVYLTRFPSGSGKWQVSGPDCAFPAWSPDGSHIYFVGPEVGIYEVQLAAEPRVMLTSPRRVVDGPKLGIDPFVGIHFADDGKSLIVLRSGRGEHPETIGIIENWYEEFRKR